MIVCFKSYTGMVNWKLTQIVMMRCRTKKHYVVYTLFLLKNKTANRDMENIKLGNVFI